jgi:hypothetical protein
MRLGPQQAQLATAWADAMAIRRGEFRACDKGQLKSVGGAQTCWEQEEMNGEVRTETEGRG